MITNAVSNGRPAPDGRVPAPGEYRSRLAFFILSRATFGTSAGTLRTPARPVRPRGDRSPAARVVVEARATERQHLGQWRGARRSSRRSTPPCSCSALARWKARDKRPILADLFGSGEIEAAADVVLRIYRGKVLRPSEPAKGTAELGILKQRDGATGVECVEFEGALHAVRRRRRVVRDGAERKAVAEILSGLSVKTIRATASISGRATTGVDRCAASRLAQAVYGLHRAVGYGDAEAPRGARRKTADPKRSRRALAVAMDQAPSARIIHDGSRRYTVALNTRRASSSLSTLRANANVSGWERVVQNQAAPWTRGTPRKGQKPGAEGQHRSSRSTGHARSADGSAILDLSRGRMEVTRNQRSLDG